MGTCSAAWSDCYCSEEMSLDSVVEATVVVVVDVEACTDAAFGFVFAYVEEYAVG